MNYESYPHGPPANEFDMIFGVSSRPMNTSMEILKFGWIWFGFWIQSTNSYVN